MSTFQNGRRMLTTNEVADRFGVNVVTVRGLVKNDGLPAVELGPRKILRFDPDDLDRWIQERRGQR